MKYQIKTHLDFNFQEFTVEAKNDFHAKCIAEKALKNRLASAKVQPKNYGLTYGAVVGQSQQKGE